MIVERILPAALLLSVVLLASSCSDETVAEQEAPHVVDPESKKLSDSASWYQTGFNRDPLSYDTALRLLAKAIEIDPRNFNAHMLQYQFAFRTGNEKLMLESTLSMHKLHPEYADVMAMVGFAYERTGDTANAKTYYERSLAQTELLLDTAAFESSWWLTSQVNKAMVLTLLHRKQEGDAALDQAAAVMSDTLMARMLLEQKKLTRDQMINPETYEQQQSSSMQPTPF
jgi:tetratricopeptide (TPR) repeat protein